MPATAGGTEGGTAGATPAAGEKPEWWASPSVVGLMGFGTTTMIAGLSNLPRPYVDGFNNNWVVFGMALAFGGIAQLIAGLIALRKGNLFAGSAFVGYGAFWISFTFMLSSFVNLAGTVGNPPTPAPVFYGVAGFAFIWALFTFSFMINAIKHGWGITMVFVFLFISFVLLVVKFWSLAADGANSPFFGSGVDNWIVGGIIILTGVIAWYVATAILTNWNYGRKVLPE